MNDHPPGAEGSREACALLLVLHRYAGRARLSSLDLANLPPERARIALHGLQDRRRVHCNGRGPTATWELAGTSQHQPQD
ncbi:MAG: hypothetical protein IPM99_18955 [Rubrivivax sp.]|nr:hypothetical protein [Rubrivivax sp.]